MAMVWGCGSKISEVSGLACRFGLQGPRAWQYGPNNEKKKRAALSGSDPYCTLCYLWHQNSQMSVAELRAHQITIQSLIALRCVSPLVSPDLLRFFSCA